MARSRSARKIVCPSVFFLLFSVYLCGEIYRTIFYDTERKVREQNCRVLLQDP